MKKPRRFCQNPFTRLEIHENGDCYFCCETWLPKPIGNILQSPLEEIWNSPVAQEIRKSIHDNSFRFCNSEYCEHLVRNTLPVQDVSTIEEFHLLEVAQEKTAILDFGPNAVNATYDRSCNLTCPTCRNDLIVHPIDSNPKIAKIHQTLIKILPQLRYLKVTGSGDPLGSPYFAKLLSSLRSEDYPGLRIFLQTNGQLFTPDRWENLSSIRASIYAFDVSVDAATEQTYLVNRRGGSFSRIMKNLEFLGEKRKVGEFQEFIISFVVQKNNWQEMAEFVRLGQRFGVDLVRFTRLKNWGTFSHSEYLSRAVHLREHPENEAFRRELTHPIFNEKIVSFSNLTEIREDQLPNTSIATEHPAAFFQNENSGLH
jgi:MoaA/NifB/PqqE/SkfB family radical SAM enzyme